jgi:hypothetical protein
MSTGEWKIWHSHTYVYFYSDTTSCWTDMSSNIEAYTPEGVTSMQGGSGEAGMPTAEPSGEASDAPGGGGGYVQSDYEVISGQYFTGYSIYKVPASVPMPYAYSTWAEVEANGDSY